jgi:hypothetical protein
MPTLDTTTFTASLGLTADVDRGSCISADAATEMSSVE